MGNSFILPSSSQEGIKGLQKADQESIERVRGWIDSRINTIQTIWSENTPLKTTITTVDYDIIADQLTQILIHRTFNFQSKKNIAAILPGIHENLVRQITAQRPIPIYLLYNGGYRASSNPDHLSLLFEPDLTELMLIYQISLLFKKIGAIYSPGIEFHIVVNNGVAHWVNEIRISDTEQYVSQLRDMIAYFGASGHIKVLVQSELPSYTPLVHFDFLSKEEIIITEKEHEIIERFLGRKCLKKEANNRGAIYLMAEKKWGEILSKIAADNDAILMRQVAHPDMLSFRPFPGGAIRIQNGSFGFLSENNTLKPKLITSESVKNFTTFWAPYSFPWTIPLQSLNTL